jgi:WD40 repeat protein/DNA-binding CsgD family transcriptional regulator
MSQLPDVPLDWGQPEAPPQLSERELEVLELVAAGMSNREIARELILAVGTIKTHIHNISTKLAAENRTQAVAHARALRLLDGTRRPGRKPAGSLGATLTNPFKGLRAFQESDAQDFFGRDALVRQLVARLNEPVENARFLAVVGPSGSGKSSVVRAGLIPALRHGAVPGSERWLIIEMIPGTHPVEELEAALLRTVENDPPGLFSQLCDGDTGLFRAVKRVLPQDNTVELLLIIDQFEELFTLVEDQATRSHFLNCLCYAITAPRNRLRVIVTLRADFYDRPLLYPNLGALFQQRSEVVLPLAPMELEQAIVGPLERVGVVPEAGLVTTIVSDVGEQAGALPMLQYALTELFEYHENRLLKLASYEASGGVLGALTRRADALYLELTDREQEVARQLFLRLVVPAEGLDNTRRRVPWDELVAVAEDEETARHIVRKFGRFRLLTFDYDPITDGPVVEIAHEALIYAWGRLHQWMDESRDDLLIHRKLVTATQEWQRGMRDPSYLLRGSRLDQFEEWVHTTSFSVQPGLREYVATSVERRAVEQAEQRDLIDRQNELERRARQWLRILVGVLTGTTAIAVMLFFATLYQSVVANDALNSELNARATSDYNAIAAEIARATSDANEILARREAETSRGLALVANSRLALSSNNVELAIALAVEAGGFEHPPSSVQLVLSEAAYSPGLRRILLESADDRIVFQVAISPDGTRILSALLDSTIILLDLNTGMQLLRLEGHDAAVTSVVFSPDGQHALSGSQDRTLILWDLENGAVLRRFVGHDHVVTDVAISRDGTRAVSGSLDRTLILWDLTTGEILQQFTGHEDSIYAVALSPDGRYALSGSDDFTARLWDLDTGAEVQRFPGEMFVTNVAFTPDSQTAVVLHGGCLSLWDVTSGQPGGSIACDQADDHSEWGLDISSDGRMALTGSELGELQLWDLVTGQELTALMAHNLVINSVAFSPDGRSAYTGSFDGSVRLWNLFNGALEALIYGPAEGPGFSRAIAVVPGSQQAIVGTRNVAAGGLSGMLLYDLATGSELRRYGAHSAVVNDIAISPDGQLAISGSEDTDAVLWDVESGQIRHRLSAHKGPVRGVAFSPDGRTVFTASGNSAVLDVAENLIIQWDVATGQEIQRWIGTSREIRSLDVSPDGTTLAVGGINSLVLWDIATATQLQRFAVTIGESAATTYDCVQFSPDGQTLLTGSSNAFISLWEVSTGTLLHRFGGHTGAVEDVAFSADGRLALSASDDGTVILWDIACDCAVRRFSGHGDSVTGVVFTPDHSRAVSVSPDSTIRQWAISDTLDELITWTRENRFYRELSAEALELYSGVMPGEAHSP